MCYNDFLAQKKYAENDKELFLMTTGQESDAAHWVREELRQRGFADWNKVLMVPSLAFAASSYFSDPIIEYPADEITHMLFETSFDESQSAQRALKLRGYLSHEKIHLEKNMLIRKLH